MLTRRPWCRPQLLTMSREVNSIGRLNALAIAGAFLITLWLTGSLSGHSFIEAVPARLEGRSATTTANGLATPSREVGIHASIKSASEPETDSGLRMASHPWGSERRWSESGMAFPVRSEIDLRKLSAHYGLPTVPPGSELESAVRSVLAQWRGPLADASALSTRERHLAHMSKVRASLDSARVGTPEALQIEMLADGEDVFLIEVWCGPGIIAPDGEAGSAISIVRPGDSPSLDAALSDGWMIHDALISELELLLTGPANNW